MCCSELIMGIEIWGDNFKQANQRHCTPLYATACVDGESLRRTSIGYDVEHVGQLGLFPLPYVFVPQIDHRLKVVNFTAKMQYNVIIDNI